LNKATASIAFSMFPRNVYLVRVHRARCVLVEGSGELYAGTCKRILGLPKFGDLASGRPTARVVDIRDCSLSGEPLTAIGRISYYTCGLCWSSQEMRMRQIEFRHQVLLRAERVARLGDQVDSLCSRIGNAAFRHGCRLDRARDTDVASDDLRDLLDCSA
jgi:hypothetical protein